MAVDVRVRRCTLTIRRRDGWSWGPSPQPHIDAALVGIEAAIESALADAGIDASVDAQLDEVVALEIGADGVASVASWTALVERLRALQPATAVAPAPRGERPAADETAEDDATPPAGDGLPPGRDADAQALARTLARWSRGGQIARVLAAWPEAVVREWLRAVAAAADAGGAGTTGALPEEAMRAIAATLLGGAAPAPAGSRAEAERLLLVIAALAAALGDRLPDGATQAAVRALVAPSASVAAAEPPAAAASERATEPAEPRIEPPALARRGAEIVPALPLLVLAQLARIGYADAMEAAAWAAGLPSGGALLGAALAGKALPAPGRGWQRRPAELAAIALVAGDRIGPGWAESVAGAAGELAPPLASALLAAYAEGRSANDEVVVTATGDGVLVGEAEGLLPVAWVAARDELDAALDALGRPPVRRADAFQPLAAALGPRRALPRADAVALERHLGAAVGTGLGLLALDLWGGHATSLVALERLGDLEAQVELSTDGLAVGIPRGRRWLDLRRGGTLHRFRVPWLPGGTLEVGTW